VTSTRHTICDADGKARLLVMSCEDVTASNRWRERIATGVPDAT